MLLQIKKSPVINYLIMIIKIIKLLKHEMSSKPIAKQLHYSIGSIEHNQRLIMKKLGVKTSVGIVAYALENL